jgi:hypothetical protein
VTDLATDSARQTTEIEQLDANERWSEYRLGGGTTLRLKPVMIAIFRADGEYTPDGDPIPVLIECLGDKVFVAEAPDLNISTTGNSVGAAFLLLKEQILSTEGKSQQARIRHG